MSFPEAGGRVEGVGLQVYDSTLVHIPEMEALLKGKTNRPLGTAAPCCLAREASQPGLACPGLRIPVSSQLAHRASGLGRAALWDALWDPSYHPRSFPVSRPSCPICRGVLDRLLHPDQTLPDLEGLCEPACPLRCPPHTPSQRLSLRNSSATSLLVWFKPRPL